MSPQATSTVTINYLKTIGIVNNGYNGRGFANPYDVAVSRDGRIYRGGTRTNWGAEHLTDTGGTVGLAAAKGAPAGGCCWAGAV